MRRNLGDQFLNFEEKVGTQVRDYVRNMIPTSICGEACASAGGGARGAFTPPVF